MSKQLGAAGDRHPVPPRGRFAALRAQPGFRTALVAFILTVVLGAGAPAAYAYWSVSSSVGISGTTAVPSTPVPAGTRCLSSPTRIQWSSVAGADSEFRYIVTFRSDLQDRSVSFALPADAQTIRPADWNLSSVFGWTAGYPLRLTATVRTAVLKVGVPNGKVTEANLAYASAPSAAATLWYSGSFYDGVRLSC